MEAQALQEVYMDHPGHDGRNTGSLKRSSSFKKLLKLPLWGNSSSNSNSNSNSNSSSNSSSTQSSIASATATAGMSNTYTDYTLCVQYQ
jgi:hypothetical protein